MTTESHWFTPQVSTPKAHLAHSPAYVITQETKPKGITNLQGRLTGITKYDLSNHLLDSTIKTNTDPKQNSQAYSHGLAITSSPYEPVSTGKRPLPAFHPTL